MYNCFQLYIGLKLLNLALDINEKINDEAGMADCYKNMASFILVREQSVSLDYYYKALFIDIKRK